MTYAYFARFGTFIISYSQFIPISMYMGLEMIKWFHNPLIRYDSKIYDHQTKKPSLARTSELIDELGQVNYVLSDKTGTLTSNSLILKEISVKKNNFYVENLVSLS